MWELVVDVIIQFSTLRALELVLYYGLYFVYNSQYNQYWLCVVDSTKI